MNSAYRPSRPPAPERPSAPESNAPPRRNARRASLTLLAIGLSLILAACSEDPPPAQPTPAPTGTATSEPAAPDPGADPAAVEPAAVDPNETVEQINARADAAVQEQRLFAPPGDNAFELYVRVIEGDPGHTFARNALTDLFPYAVMHVEQRLAARDAADAERVLVLMERANASAPALPRLRREVDGMQARIAAEAEAEAVRQQRVAEAAAAATAAAEETPEPAPTTAPIQPAPTVAAPPPEPTAPAPVASTPPPPVTQPAPEPAPSVSAGGLPRVVRMSQPRYPPLALRRNVEGFVEVSFTVQPDGRVTNVEVVRSEPGNIFNREAVSAMEKWVFESSSAPSEGRRTFDFKLARDE